MILKYRLWGFGVLGTSGASISRYQIHQPLNYTLEITINFYEVPGYHLLERR